jgi:uncharacterized protein (DUF1810 family)
VLIVSAQYDLERFVRAQNPIYRNVMDELRAGRKTSHWMWFIFPQIKGLGSSPTAQRYAIESRDEAEAYLQHKILGARLIECTQVVLAARGVSVDEIFGYPDNLKFHSSMTLFSVSAPSSEPPWDVFYRALEAYFGGRKDEATLKRLTEPTSHKSTAVAQG